MEVNRAYFLDYVTTRTPPAGRVLDYGCGDGSLVAELRGLGVDCVGADIFYGGGAFDSPETRGLMEAGYVRHFEEDGRVPFEDCTFDLLVSNQVFEHVSNLEPAVRELHRVLKPGGTGYHHFPSREVLREGHIGIPLAHQLAVGSVRREYVVLLRAMGLGYHKGESTHREWADQKLAWLDRYCHYRPYAEIIEVFARYFEVTHREIDYCRFRARHRELLASVLRVRSWSGFAERVFRRLAFMALETRKR
jgi:SAM-dependent methyltransferase